MAPGPVSPRAERRALLASCAAVVCLGVACYAHTLDVPWYFDDFPQIVKNPAVHDLGRALDGVLSQRGLGNFTFAANVAASGLSLAPFHATNIAVHLAAGLAALLVLRRVFPARPLVALLGALLFVAHPLQTQAVTYVVQRLASLAGLLCLVATYLYLLARDARDAGTPAGNARVLVPYAGALACGAAALLAKENAATLPALLALCELYLPRSPSAPAPRWRGLAWAAPFTVVPALLALQTVAGGALAPGGGTLPAAPFETDVVGGASDTPRLAYLATEFGVVWRYLRLVVWPAGQMFDAGLAVPPEPFRAAAVIAGGALAALIGAALAVRRRAPLVTFGVLWFLVALSVESTIIPLDPYFEHRLYLPMLGVSVLFASTLESAVSSARARLAAGGAVVAALAALTWARNEQWRDPAALWAADVAAGSASYRSALGLADAYHERGDAARAREVYAGFLARGTERCRQGGCGGRYLLNLGVTAERLGELDAAQEHYARALQADRSYASAHLGLGVVAYRRGRKQDALAHFREAVQLAPADAVALANLATVALELGDASEAERHLPRIRTLDPRRAAALERELAAARTGGVLR